MLQNTQNASEHLFFVQFVIRNGYLTFDYWTFIIKT